MKKAMVCALVCLALSAAAAAADPYKLLLKDGTVVVLDAKPTIQGGTATLVRGGVAFTLPASEIDFPASEKANPPAASSGSESKPEGPKRYTDEDLPRLRETSPLASDGAAAAPVSRTPPPSAERRQTSDAKLQDLYDKEDRLRKERAEWLQRMDEFQDQADRIQKEQAEQDYKYSRSDTTTTRGAEQAKWQKQQEARRAKVQKDLANAREKVQDLDAKLEDVRQEIYRAYDQTK